MTSINNKNNNNTITMDVIRDCSPTRPKLHKISNTHSKSLLDQINQLRRTNELCDVFLLVGNSKIAAHKIILRYNINYYKLRIYNEVSLISHFRISRITLKLYHTKIKI
jgi:hypothetical protein